MMKVLWFGDSNVFGFCPSDMSRFDKQTRWSGILAQNLLKKNISVLEDGMNNRTCFSKNQTVETTGILVIEKHFNKNFDKVILQIGINDLQKQYNVSLKDFEIGLEEFIKKIQNGFQNCEILILIPAEINENILKSYFYGLFDESSVEKSKRLTEIYKKIANENKCSYLDLNEIAKVSEIDSLHYDKNEHLKIAKAIEKTL